MLAIAHVPCTAVRGVYFAVLVLHRVARDTGGTRESCTSRQCVALAQDVRSSSTVLNDSGAPIARLPMKTPVERCPGPILSRSNHDLAWWRGFKVTL